MNDTFIMSSAFLDSLRPPIGCVGGRQPRPASPAAKCYMCREALIEIEFKGHFVLVCDNWRCPVFRQPQSSRAKRPEPAVRPAQGVFLSRTTLRNISVGREGNE